MTSDAWVKMPRAVLCDATLTPTAKLVFAVVVDRIGSNGHAWPGMRRIAADCGLCASTVVEAVRALEAGGWLAVSRVAGNPGGRTNSYAITDRTENRALENPNIPETERSALENQHVERSVSSTERDQDSKPRQETNRRAASDPWEIAQAAMTGTTLKTDGFKAAWASWATYRTESRKRLTGSTIQRQIRELEQFGEPGAIASIEQSIRNGWVGLFAPKSGNGKPTPARVGAPAGKYAARGSDFGGPQRPLKLIEGTE